MDVGGEERVADAGADDTGAIGWIGTVGAMVEAGVGAVTGEDVGGTYLIPIIFATRAKLSGAKQ